MSGTEDAPRPLCGKQSLLAAIGRASGPRTSNLRHGIAKAKFASTSVESLSRVANPLSSGAIASTR
jgi:hypothetical protein